MSDGSVDDDLFADSDHTPGLTGVPKVFVEDDDADDSGYTEVTPAYVRNSPEFADFADLNEVKVHNRHGYVCIFLYRDFYFPGQTVRGFALLDAF